MKNYQDDLCLYYLEVMVWPKKVRCSYCNSNKVYQCREVEKRRRWKCVNCKRSFSATLNTFLHGSHVPVYKWFKLARLLFVEKPDKPTIEGLSHELKVGRRTAKSMMDRLKAVKSDNCPLLHQIIAFEKNRKENEDKI